MAVTAMFRRVRLFGPSAHGQPSGMQTTAARTSLAMACASGSLPTSGTSTSRADASRWRSSPAAGGSLPKAWTSADIDLAPTRHRSILVGVLPFGGVHLQAMTSSTVAYRRSLRGRAKDYVADWAGANTAPTPSSAICEAFISRSSEQPTGMRGAPPSPRSLW